jgi:hypothetical protein
VVSPTMDPSAPSTASGTSQDRSTAQSAPSPFFPPSRPSEPPTPHGEAVGHTLGIGLGIAMVILGTAGLIATVSWWSSFVAPVSGCPACPPGPPPELDPNNAVLVITGVVLSAFSLVTGALFVLIASLLEPRKLKRPD